MPAVPDLTSFPRTDWAWAVRETCRNAPNAALDYGDPRGSEVLRTVLASYLARVRGADAAPERLVVCTGFSQGLNLVLRCLARSGVRRVGFEDPGYDETSAYATAFAGRRGRARAGRRVVASTWTRWAGPRCRRSSSHPAHQWPTGVVLSPERRHALVAWAADRDAIIIEDDYDAEFRYDREPVGALQGLAPDRVVALGTVSKSLAPTLRLGWILCPPSLVEAVAEREAASRPRVARAGPAGRRDADRVRPLRPAPAPHARPCTRSKRDVLVGALARHAPEVALTRPRRRLPRRRAPAGVRRRAGGHRRGPCPLGRPVRDERQPVGRGLSRRSSSWASATSANGPSRPASPRSATCSAVDGRQADRLAGR